jgi:DNA polymerase-3 subunit gamma/tau
MLNLIDDDVYFNFSDAILKKDFIQAFEISKIVYDNGWNYIDFTNGLIEHFRNILTTVLKKDTSFVETSDEFKKKYINYINSFSESDLLRILLYLSKVEKEIKISQNQKLYIELALSHLIGIESSSTITEILNNIPKDLVNSDKSFEKHTVAQIVNKVSSEKSEENNEIHVEKSIKNITNIDDNLSNDEIPLINAIINELGGREFK